MPNNGDKLIHKLLEGMTAEVVSVTHKADASGIQSEYRICVLDDLNSRGYSFFLMLDQRSLERDWEYDGGRIDMNGHNQPEISSVQLPKGNNFDWLKGTPSTDDVECKGGRDHDWRPSRTEGYEHWCSKCGTRE